MRCPWLWVRGFTGARPQWACSTNQHRAASRHSLFRTAALPQSHRRAMLHHYRSSAQSNTGHRPYLDGYAPMQRRAASYALSRGLNTGVATTELLTVTGKGARHGRKVIVNHGITAAVDLPVTVNGLTEAGMLGCPSRLIFFKKQKKSTSPPASLPVSPFAARLPQTLSHHDAATATRPHDPCAARVPASRRSSRRIRPPWPRHRQI